MWNCHCKLSGNTRLQLEQDYGLWLVVSRNNHHIGFSYIRSNHFRLHGANVFVGPSSNGNCTASTANLTITRNANPNYTVGSNQILYWNCHYKPFRQVTQLEQDYGLWLVVQEQSTTPSSATSGPNHFGLWSQCIPLDHPAVKSYGINC
jgi:hypothetical protein